MSDGLFSAVEFGPGERVGFRLHHVEVFNWGTFDKRVWRLTPGGDTSLLTGDIGSGKSTLVDAVTTLLLPAHKISYNKAAGAESKERTLRSYVEGHYKSERIEASGASRAVGLRDQHSYSVILGVFTNDGFDETVTLAQVFHQKQRTGQPDRFFVTSDKELSIEADFTAFGSNLTDLRRRLRATGAEIEDVFTKYSARLRRLLGIRSDQAMELFHQTVSMKSVGNLNEFVRDHMLEPVDATERVKGIVGHFEDLRKAHDAVRRARDQLAALDPLVATCDRYDDAVARRRDTEGQREAVRLYFAELRSRLLTAEIEANSQVRRQRHAEADETAAARDTLAQAREGLIAERAGAGGDRLGELDQAEAAAEREAGQRQGRHSNFDVWLTEASLPPVASAAGFAALQGQLPGELASLGTARADVDEQLSEQLGRRKELQRLGEETRAELTSLASRSSNLPSSQLDVRTQLCHDLGIEESSLPFAGELLDVSEAYADWRGAAERVLRGFALSLLVPQQHYEAVARWVNEHRLTYRRRDGSTAGVKLVYERVPQHRVALQSRPSKALMLADTLAIAEGPFRDYLRDELVKRAGYRCVNTVAEFGDADRAVTRAGQVRSGDRHEKDDRSRVDDPRSWVLGWVNERKVAALTEELVARQADLLEVEEQLELSRGEQSRLSDRHSSLQKLTVYSSWAELDWQEAKTRAAAINAERERLVSGSSRLAEIERLLADNARQSKTLEERLRTLSSELGKLDDRIDQATSARTGEEEFLAEHHAGAIEAARASYSALEGRLGDHVPKRADACATVASQLTDELDAVTKRINTELGGYAQSMLQYMGEIRRRWPEATTELDASVEARDEFRAFHARVSGDDLPRFEEEFKRQLNTNTIRELAGFNNWLNRQAETIGERVARINEALGAIDYSPGRYIELVAERTINTEIQGFRADLRDATTDALAPDDDQYSEQRFLDVQRIIERFRGREGHAESDKTWTRRVTDVRNWFSFSASERDKGTDEEWEHYRDSDGKSGGQKEKLAYTILAASLAYQFGLEWGVERSRDFRFAVIDEAFGRGSDASTRYALELFAKLGLQLLIVTPLQKVHVIEPYVHSIGFVDNPSGNYSRLQTMTIEEYRERRAKVTP